MRIFEGGDTWFRKINFVDTNDVYVGFNIEQSCCEDFGHLFVADDPAKLPETEFTLCEDKAGNYLGSEWDGRVTEVTPMNLEEMVFDRDYIQELPDRDGGGFAVFRLFDPRLATQRTDVKQRELERMAAQEGWFEEVFLVLFNHHNGYYSHGFSMTHNGITIHEGGI